jgi:hypothetical protein
MSAAWERHGMCELAVIDPKKNIITEELSSQLHLFEKQKTHIFYNLLKQMCACA